MLVNIQAIQALVNQIISTERKTAELIALQEYIGSQVETLRGSLKELNCTVTASSIMQGIFNIVKAKQTDASIVRVLDLTE